MPASRTCCEPEAPPGGACPCPDPAADAGALPAERNRYFTGKYMTARDLQAEQGYFVGRHRFHQRVLHGWGIVAGLDVVPHPNRECALNGWVVVTPGVAVDCYGREVVVYEPTPLLLPAVFPDDVACGAEETKRKWDKTREAYFPDPPPQANTKYLLVVKYTESCVENVPVFADADGCAPRKTANRVSEGVCFRFMEYNADKPPACWRRPRPPECPCPPETPTYPPKFPASLEAVLGETCDADCKGAVPLAVVEFFEGKTKEPGIPPEYLTDPAKYIDVEGRRYLPGPLNRRQLTHVCDISWRHGEDTPIDDLLDGGDEPTGKGEVAEQEQSDSERDDRLLTLWVQFDRELNRRLPLEERENEVRFAKDIEPDPVSEDVGFYRRVLRLAFQNDKGELQPLPWLLGSTAALSDDRTRLAYTFPVWALQNEIQGNLETVLHVTLHCNFLTDRWGRAVDGDHLRGSLARGPSRGPSGDGVEGGTFESWFRLTDIPPRPKKRYSS